MRMAGIKQRKLAVDKLRFPAVRRLHKETYCWEDLLPLGKAPCTISGTELVSEKGCPHQLLVVI